MPFTDIIGHDKEIDILKRGILQDRIPHAFLFAGPNGIGKKMTAFAFAKALNCERCKDDFCGECQNCRAIDNSSFMDVFLVEPREPDYKGGAVDHVSGTIKEDDINSVQQRINYRSKKGSKKVCIVDDAEKMNRVAQNKFLKTLEEPAPDSVIILVTCKPSELIPTVLSRCQRINFMPIKKDVISGFILDKLNISKEEADVISSLSGGSIGTALKMDMDWILKKRRQIIERFEGLSLDKAEDILKFADEISKEEDLDAILEFLKIWHRDIMVSSVGRDEMVINMDMLPVIKKHVSGFTHERAVTGLMAIEEARRNIMPPRYANKQLAMENLFIGLAR